MKAIKLLMIIGGLFLVTNSAHAQNPGEFYFLNIDDVPPPGTKIKCTCDPTYANTNGNVLNCVRPPVNGPVPTSQPSVIFFSARVYDYAMPFIQCTPDGFTWTFDVQGPGMVPEEMIGMWIP
jgi:hypothetical protein